MKKVIVVILLLVLAAGGVYYYRHGYRCTVYVNNESCVTLANTDTAERLINSIKNDYSAKYGKNVSLIEKIDVRKGGSEKVSDEKEAGIILRKKLTPGIEGFAVIADGKTVCGFRNKEEAGKFLQYSKNRFAPASGEYEEPEFKEKVLITGTLVDPELICDSSEEAFDKVFRNKAVKNGYKVRRGDTASHIAAKHALKLKELSQLNPGYNLNRLKPGDILNVSSKKVSASLTVVVRQEKTVTETVKPEVTKVSSEILPYGKTKVINPGKPGKKQTRYAVCLHNGKEVSKEIISEEYITMPVNRQVAVGIKAAIP